MNKEEFLDERKRYRTFQETELGKLYESCLRKTAAYWSVDQTWTESYASLKKKADAMEEAQKALRLKLMEIAGV